MIHLTIHQLSSYIDRELPVSSTELVRRHLESCEECTRRFGVLQEQEAILNRVLVHDPGAAFFVRFPGLVLEEEAKARESARGGADRRAADRRAADRRVDDRRVAERRVGGGDRRGTADRRGSGRAAGEAVGGTNEGATPTTREVATDAGVAPARPIVSWKPVAPEEVVASGAMPAEREATAKSPVHVPPPALPVEIGDRPTLEAPPGPPKDAHRAGSSRREEHPQRARRGPARGTQPAIPWFAALILCVVVGALAYVLPRPGSRPPVERPAPAASESPRESNPAPGRETSRARAGRKSAGVERRAARVEDEAGAEQGVAAVEQGAAGAEPHTSATSEEAPAPAGAAIQSPSAEPEAPEAETAAPDRAPARAEPLPPRAPADDVVPVRRFITTTEAAPGRPSATAPTPRRASQPAPRAKPDEFAAAPESARPLVLAAQSASRAAVLDSSAANLDAAADAWDRAIPSLDGSLQTAARRNLAEARYRAWLAAPDPYRVANATAALRAYLVFAPPGPTRDAAKTWLQRISGRP